MIIQERLTINGREFVRTYSDAGRYVVGGSPEGQYAEAVDPEEFNRHYTEGELMPEEERIANPDNATAEDYEAALSEMGVQL